MITVKNLTKTFGKTVAVDKISFEVQKGEIVGFLGPNGAGKTTTMKVLTCYIPADSGTAKVADFNVDDNPLEIKKRIGYLPENNPLYFDMGIVDYLDYIAEIRGIPSNKRVQRIREVVEKCSLEREIKKDIGELSKGFRQRVGLAQSLIHDPDILILDEPTSGLDPNQIIEIRDLIKKIGKEKTIILSTHILPEVTATCNRAIIINEGKIVADGTPDEIVSKGQSGFTLKVKIKAPKDEIESKFREVSGIKEAKMISENNGYLRYELKIEGKNDPSEDIFHLVVRNNWVLTELRPEFLSLEDVFKKLTIGD